MGRQLCLIHLGSDGGADDGGAVFVAHIILYDENGTDPALFAANHRAQICKINISTSDDHIHTPRCLDWSAAEEKICMLCMRNLFFAPLLTDSSIAAKWQVYSLMVKRASSN